MTVERDGRWYVSVEYTVAEYVRRAAGWEIPAPVTRTPVGFDSPEEAATAFYDRLASLDLQSALDTFAPGEDADGVAGAVVDRRRPGGDRARSCRRLVAWRSRD